ncbi:MAG: DNA mismatch repair endonuclease MutL, partial [Halanaerobium sp.]|nr:DNA mismatch repair endonuclease MutL [Halanaerobium sp.]
MGRIRVLNDEIINQIAAGEVIEHPASVVKELVENSLDAGSSRIQISVTRGGLDEIVVSDNGHGMSREDAELAFKRHATSKISRFTDLLSLRTLGFRGEALPSIASVAKIRLVTREKGEIKGHQLTVNEGQMEEIKSVGAPVGTTLFVTKLFANVPVRYKYLRSPSQEFREIRSILEGLALSRPEVAFELSHNQRDAFSTPGTASLRDVIFALYGREMAREIVKVQPKELNYVKVSGFAGKPQLSRKSRRYQSFFVNGRSVRNPELNKALQEAYAGLIGPQRYPVAFLFIEINPVHIDVNIHPTKKLVRFSREKIVTEAITKVVKDTLQGVDKIPEVKMARKGPDMKESSGDWNKKPGKKSWEETRFSFGEDSTSRLKPDYGKIISSNEMAEDNAGNELVREMNTGNDKTMKITSPRIIGQFLNCYILLQQSDQLWIVDQHTAHERVNYERILAEYNNKRTIPGQDLLIPLNIHLTEEEIGIVQDNMADFTRIGFLLEDFGGKNVLIRTCPALKGLSSKELFLDIVDLLREGRGDLSPGQYIDEAITLI